MTFNQQSTLYYCIIAIAINYTVLVDMYRVKERRFQKVREFIMGGFVIFRQQPRCREYLLLQQSKEKMIFEDELQRLWSTPRGAVKHREGVFRAACTALKEMTGIKKDDITIIPGFNLTITYGEFIKWNDVTYFIGQLNNTNVKIKLSPQHLRYIWLPYKKACDTAEPEEVTRTIIVECEAFLRKQEEEEEEKLYTYAI